VVKQKVGALGYVDTCFAGVALSAGGITCLLFHMQTMHVLHVITQLRFQRPAHTHPPNLASPPPGITPQAPPVSQTVRRNQKTTCAWPSWAQAAAQQQEGVRGQALAAGGPLQLLLAAEVRTGWGGVGCTTGQAVM
jgi:hypothetical protein